MFIGTQYYRPPHPPQADWERDIQNVADTGLTLIRIWIYWSQVNPRSDQWVWNDVDAFFDAAEKQRLQVLVQLMPDAMPYWFKDAHPEALFCDRNGNIVQPVAGGAMAVGGIPGPNYDHPTAQAFGGDFIRRTVERYTSHPALYAWDVWNELWPFVISPNSVYHSQSTVDKWHHWLQKEYGTIEALNDHWMRSYPTFEEVEWPVAGIFSDLGTRYRFDQDRVADWMKWRVHLVRQLDPDHLVVAHTGGIGPVAALNDPWGGDLTDPWLFTDSLDVWGTSCYLPDFHQWSFLLDSTRSASQGKPFWIFEMNGGRGHYRPPGPGFYSNYLRSAEEIRSQVLLTFSHGGEGAVFWQWRPEHFGPESPGWGLANAAGELTERTKTLHGITEMLQRHRDLFDAAVFPEPQVGIIWEPLSYQAERLANWRPDFGYLGGFELLGYHKAFTALGLSVAYLNGRTLVERGIPGHLRLLVHPYPIAHRDGLAEQIAEWVDRGGTFVAGPWVGMFDSRLNGSFRIPPQPWQTLLGVRQQEIHYPDEPAIRLLLHAPTGAVERLPGYHLMETYMLTDAEPLGVWKSSVTAAIRTHGQGRVLSLGTFLGQPLAFDRTRESISWIAALCQQAGIDQTVHVVGEGVFSRLADIGDSRLLFVHNTGDQNAFAWISCQPLWPGMQVRNLISNQIAGDVTPRTPLCISLAARDSAVYLLTPL